MEKLKFKHKTELEAFETQKAENRRLWNIDEETAKLLYFLINSKVPKRALEIGTSNGYSTFWLSLGLEDSPTEHPSAGQYKTEPHTTELHTIEAFDERFEMAKKNLGNRTNVIQHFGKAEQVIPTLNMMFDFVFIDAGKIGYIDYIKLLQNKLLDGALIIADNVASHTETVQDYLDFVNEDPNFTTMRLDIGAGLELSIFRKV